jgi:DNA-binding transcriptional LysR family regulator
MDRLEAMRAFVATVDAGSLAAAARLLGTSPASITRAVALVEERTKTQLLRRTTRSLKLTAAGERYANACRRILAELAEVERDAAGDEAPRGTLTVTAPIVFGRRHVRTIVDELLAQHRELDARLLLLDRIVHLIDEGVDVAIRIAHMPDSALIGVRVGEVRRIVCASPAYLERHGVPAAPEDLAEHACIALTALVPTDRWRFAAGSRRGARRPRIVRVHPRLAVNTADAALASAVEGRGLTCVLSYQAEELVASGKLRRVLAKFEPEPLPVHVVYAASSARTAKVRAFVELAVPHLRAALASG